MQGYKRVDGPSEEELKKKHEEGRKNSPFSNSERTIHLSCCLLQSGNMKLEWLQSFSSYKTCIHSKLAS